MNNSTKPTVLTANDIMKPVSQAFPKAKTWWVACSGGVDSVLLAKLAVDFLGSQTFTMPTIKLLHINHQLQSKSDEWQQHCESFAKNLGLSIVCEKVEINTQGKGLEAEARAARYAVFNRYVEADDVLLMGHHLNDQAETFLLRVLRGAGLKGLRAIPQQRALTSGMLFRPLLNVNRESIELTAKQLQLTWVEDPSNQQDNFDRNYLRLHVLPLIEKRWPQALQKIQQVTKHAESSQMLLNDLAVIDTEKYLLLADDDSLCLKQLLMLSIERQNNILRYWLELQSQDLPSRIFLLQLRQQFIDSETDAQPVLKLGEGELRRFQHRLYFYCQQEKFAEDFVWQLSQPLVLSPCSQLSAILIEQAEYGDGLKKLDQLKIRFRQGGEKIIPHYTDSNRSVDMNRELKKIFQELAIPTWLRDEVPLLYHGVELVAVADKVIAKQWLAEVGEQAWKINWNFQNNDR